MQSKSYAVLSYTRTHGEMEPAEAVQALRNILSCPGVEGSSATVDYVGTKKPMVFLGEKHRDTTPDEPSIFDHLLSTHFTAAKALADVGEELIAARIQFRAMRSPHEGYAILLEEVDELWQEVKKQHDVRSSEAMRKEAMQVAAMALAFMVECT